MLNKLTLFLFLLVLFLGSELLATPNAPRKIQGARSADGESFTLTWTSPTFRTDGNILAAGELGSYKILRSNALSGGTTVVSFSVPGATSTLTDNDTEGRTFYYRVRAVDTSVSESPDSETVSSNILNTAYFLADDNLSYASVSGVYKAALDAEGTKLRGTRLTSTEGNQVFKSISFDAIDTVTNQIRQNYILTSPVTFGIGYSVGGDGLVFSNSLRPAVSIPNATTARFGLSIFWNNGAKFIKVGSSVDTTANVAETTSRLTGSYQLRFVSQPLSAQLNAVYPRTITPNSDGINDRVFFLFENPSQDQAAGTVYDSRSAKVADLLSTNIFGGDTVLFWDGFDTNGAPVSGGYYIYKLKVGSKKFSGTVGVVR